MLGGKAFCNGKWIESNELFIHISDLSIHRAYAVFDYMKEKDSKVHWIEDYLDRFERSIALSGINIFYPKKEIHRLILQMINMNGFGLSGIKLLATGGYSPNGFDVPAEANFYILNYKGKSPSPEVYKKGIVLIHDNFQRPNPEIKTTQYFNTAQLYKKMKKYNADDVLYHYRNIITETSRANFYIIKDGIIKTSGGNVLSGITRKQFIKTFEKNYPIDFDDILFTDLNKNDEAFITSTTRGIVPVVQIEDIQIGDGKVGKLTKELMGQFNRFN